jgi:hypothetical protein
MGNDGTGNLRTVAMPLMCGFIAFAVEWTVWYGTPYGMPGSNFVFGTILMVALFASCVVWASAYLAAQSLFVFLPAAQRPWLAFVWGLGWFVLASILQFVVLLPLTGWSLGAYLFTCVTAVVHRTVLVRKSMTASPPPLPDELPPPLPDRPSDVSAGKEPPQRAQVSAGVGLALAFLAMVFSGAAMFTLVYLRHFTDENLVFLFFGVLASLPWVFPYLAAYLLLGWLNPLVRPLFAPLWGLGWFLLMVLYVVVPYFHLYGFDYVSYAYQFTCLTAALHLAFMYAYRMFAASGGRAEG